MVNIGMDFGSTYTTVSVFRKETHTLEALSLSQGMPYIPSVVSVGKGAMEFGMAAKTQAGKKGITVFKAFKMMLTESGPKRLEARGFAGENTPGRIAREFIGEVLRQVLSDMHEDRIGTLVVGVPEVWSDGIGTLDGRTIVRDICRSLDFVEQVKVVSEPAAASAFFVHNFHTSTGRDFEGNILLVDYGGGTLDITLTEVAAGKGSEDENFAEIKVLERTGAGENVEGEVGKAGIVYMETVVSRAIAKSDVLGGKKPERDGKYYRAVDALELDLQTGTRRIQDMFEEYGLDDMEGLYEEEFTTIEYKGEDVEVSYGLLLEVYNDTIRNIFDEKLNEMIQFMQTANIRYMDGGQDTFKIALVGGFGNFYLVKKQIEDKFRFSLYDKRRENIILNKADCERAISLGAALLAAGVIGIRNTAAYSIGVWAYDINKNVCLNYAIRYKQDIEFNKVYYARGSVDNEVFVIQAISGGFDKFLVNFGHDDRTACFALAREEFAKKLANVVKNQYHTAVVGFSIDPSGVVSIHVHDYDVLKGEIGEEDHEVELTKFGDLFEVTYAGQPFTDSKK